MLNNNYNFKHVFTIYVLFIFLNIFEGLLSVEYDISKGKNITQSNTVVGFEPNLYATDGNINTYFKITHSNNAVAWLQIDLNGLYNLSKIILWTTDYDEYFLARHIAVYTKIKHNVNNIFETAVELPSSEYTKGGSALNPSRASQIIYSTAEPRLTRYVWIGKRDGQYKHETLYLAEIVVLTEAISYIFVDTKNISQSQTYKSDISFIASNAIDGNNNTCSYTAQEDPTKRNTSGWLKIDLGDNYKIVKFKFLDINTLNELYNGFYSIYVEEIKSNLNNLCFDFNQSSAAFKDFYEINCLTIINGRYITFIKNSIAIKIYNRSDSLFFCEIQIYTTNTAQVYSNSTYIQVSTTRKLTSILETTSIQMSSSLNYSINMLNKINDKDRTGIIVGCVVGIISAIIFFIVTLILCKRFKVCPAKRIFSQSLFCIKRKSKPKEFSINNTSSTNSVINRLITDRTNAATQFAQLANENVKSVTVATSPQNREKNRFQNIFAFDDNLVKLNIEHDDDLDKDYINASYIQGLEENSNKYIATQGPIPATVKDMWRLIWQQGISTIVMLTQLVEGKKKKVPTATLR